ncbi:MAG: bile acid:sodium symporter [Paludibacteraceae bacterium]|nr:bile acid:sodium symporter [Paludibacteraceae bacterium]
MVNKEHIKRFINQWILLIAMIFGISAYLIYHNLNLSAETRGIVNIIVDWAIPTMVLAMLYITFCKVNLRQLKFTRWHLSLVVFQLLLMVLITTIASFLQGTKYVVLAEAAFICVASPTATGSVVVLTQRWGGNSETTTTYTLISNLITAFFVPVLIPFISTSEHTLTESFLMILRRVTPLLVVPMLMALITQIFFPVVVNEVKKWKDLPLYLWAVAMCLAISLTLRYLISNEFGLPIEIAVAGVSMVVCILLFYSGKRIGRGYGEHIGAGQGLAQRNTVFIIWLGSTFLHPSCAIAGGFYSLWQNLFNTWQMRKFEKEGKI